MNLSQSIWVDLAINLIRSKNRWFTKVCGHVMILSADIINRNDVEKDRTFCPVINIG